MTPVSRRHSSCSDGWQSDFEIWSGEFRDRGHEIASHGYAHRLIYDQTPAAFREDVRTSKDLLEQVTGEAGQRVSGTELLGDTAHAVGARCVD